ncbi:MAG TPA: sugar phosphate isomerase/epimerase family protein [Phycisphaerae bacterium]|nr:sugar phosphate isomerase/epimerase family protein [Phycisphaerae bacterium]
MNTQSNRREFLQRTAAAAAAATVGVAGGPTLAAEGTRCPMSANKKSVLKLSCQESRVPGKELPEKLDLLEKWGFEGIEFGGKGLPGRVDEIKKAMAGRKIKASAICAGFEGWLIAQDPKIRTQCMDSMKEILTAAGALGSVGMILVPSFNQQDEQGSLPHKDARVIISPFVWWTERKEIKPKLLLQELGEHAVQAGTTAILEPLNRKECYFLRQLADAASICRDCDHPGVTMMGDFWHMTWEETSDLGAFISAGDHLTHVHIASRRKRRMPGEDGEADNYVDGFRGLKMIGYKNYISFECGCDGDPMERIPAAVKLIRDQWAQA